MKIAYVFAGQGSQKVGMGQSLYNGDPKVKALLDSIQLDFDYKDLCFNGPIEILSQTKYTQPCMVSVAIACVNILRDHGIEPNMVAGLSLGEYSSLYCAGVFDAKTVMDLVYYRGQVMTNAAQNIESKMVAILGLDKDILETCIKEASTLGTIQIANYNCPGQLVIGGEIKAVDYATKLALDHKAKRAIPLNTSGPFHTSLLKQAGDDLANKFKEITFNEMKIPVIFNCTAKPIQDDQTIPELLEKQVQSPVYFENSIRYMINQGIDTFIEIGPGKVLSGFIKKIDRKLTCLQVEDIDSVNKVIEIIKGGQ